MNSRSSTRCSGGALERAQARAALVRRVRNAASTTAPSWVRADAGHGSRVRWSARSDEDGVHVCEARPAGRVWSPGTELRDAQLPPRSRSCAAGPGRRRHRGGDARSRARVGPALRQPRPRSARRAGTGPPPCPLSCPGRPARAGSPPCTTCGMRALLPLGSWREVFGDDAADEGIRRWAFSCLRETSPAEAERQAGTDAPCATSPSRVGTARTCRRRPASPRHRGLARAPRSTCSSPDLLVGGRTACMRTSADQRSSSRRLLLKLVRDQLARSVGAGIDRGDPARRSLMLAVPDGAQSKSLRRSPSASRPSSSFHERGVPITEALESRRAAAYSSKCLDAGVQARGLASLPDRETCRRGYLHRRPPTVRAADRSSRGTTIIVGLGRPRSTSPPRTRRRNRFVCRLLLKRRHHPGRGHQRGRRLAVYLACMKVRRHLWSVHLRAKWTTAATHGRASAWRV